MVLLTLLACIMLLVAFGTIVTSALSGVGTLLFFCIAAVVCVLCGLGILLKLLAKGVFSFFKCAAFLILMAVPAVNVLALVALCVICIKTIKE